MKDTPFVIFIDGIDGCGKTSLAQELLVTLARNKPELNIRTTDVMRHTPVGKDIRQAMITEEMDETLRYMGFMYGVFYGLDKIFHLEDGTDVVICDRSQATPYAYNIHAPAMNEEIKKSQTILFDDLNKKFAAKYRGRFANVHLRLDPKEAHHRLFCRGQGLDVIERRGPAFQKEVADGYVSYFNKNPNNTSMFRFDTSLASTEEMANEISFNFLNNNVV